MSVQAILRNACTFFTSFQKQQLNKYHGVQCCLSENEIKCAEESKTQFFSQEGGHCEVQIAECYGSMFTHTDTHTHF